MKAFISYSHRDQWALDRLHVHLAQLHREGLIEAWYDREILAGDSIDEEIAGQMNTCELFICLVSPDFIASNYCYEREMTSALGRQDAGEVRVVPIIIEPCEWKVTPLGRLKALPRDGKPISDWTNDNTAFLDVTTELRRVVSAGVAAVPAEERPSSVPTGRAAAYRVKREFDEIDRSDYREQAFNAIRQYFERSIAEIDGIEGLRGRFTELGPQTFGCTVVNKGLHRGIAHLTVHIRSGDGGFHDVYYSYSENAPPNTANGGFEVEADEYDLFLVAHRFTSNGEERLSPERAAEQLWIEFLEHAGVTV